jgi:hypothetical protein
VFAGWFSTTFWRVKLHDVECTVEEMEEAAEGAFLTGPIFKNPFEERGVADLTGICAKVALTVIILIVYGNINYVFLNVFKTDTLYLN